jgi:hypothetical protein
MEPSSSIERGSVNIDANPTAAILLHDVIQHEALSSATIQDETNLDSLDKLLGCAQEPLQ